MLSQVSIQNVLMPVNSPLNQDLNLFEISSTNYPQTLSPPIYEVSQTDIASSYVNYWTFASDQNMLYLPWVPFFTNCQGYGNKILWFDLLEYDDQCQLKSVDDTTIVESIPTTGIEANADYCNIRLNCSFAEEARLTTNLIKWWQINDKMTVYYLPSYGISSNDYFKNRDGQTTYYSNLIGSNTDDMVPVIFSSENFITDYYPSTVTMKLEYYQVSKTVKKLVKANVVLSNFQSVDPNSLHPSYTLNVVFTAMGFLDLINAFQFGFTIYFFAFILFYIFTIMGIVLFWGFNKLISKRENPPILKFVQTVKIVIWPQIKVINDFIVIKILIFRERSSELLQFSE